MSRRMTMQDDERTRLTEESIALRQFLKAWENKFRADNGRKANRDDIKQAGEIAVKYKEYNRLQDLISGKVPPPKVEAQSRPKRKADADNSLVCSEERASPPTHETPKKRRAIEKLTTPSHGRILQPTDTNPFSSPSTVRNLFTPQKPVAIGPTPQKDGKLLGLFDLLPDESPEKQDRAGGAIVNVTPSKSGAHSETGETLATPTGPKHSRTPRSNSKRFLLDAFMTPLKRRLSNAGSNTKKSVTPSSVSKLNFSTPLFLRRDNLVGPKLEAVKEEDEDAVISPEAPTPKGPRRPLVRGLSSMLASLREMQDTALDEDEEAMRELEDGGEPAQRQRPLSASKLKLAVAPLESPAVQPDALSDGMMHDSQRQENPFMEFPDLDFNKDIESDDGEDEMNEQEKRLVEQDSKLLVYKKKGQKRTTRRHNMKPVSSKKSPAKRHKPAKDDDILSDNEVHDLLAPAGMMERGMDSIPDARHATFSADSLPLFQSKRNFDSESEDGTEYTASIGGTRYQRAKRPNDHKTDRETRKHKAGAQVHTNYQRLKIRGNTGMRGKSAGGRFGKRRL